MKICLLGDCHFGVRNGSKSFNEYFDKFYTNIFFPYLKNNNIQTVVQLGDLMDNRKQTHIHSLFECKKYFFDRFDEYNIQLISIVGNHDSHFRDTIKVNSPKLMLGEYKNIKIIESPCIESVFDKDVLFLPWICKENFDESFSMIGTSKTDICFGHLELKEFAMHKGIICEDGMEPSIFDKFEFVFTGHYHHRSNRGNIYYLGTPYELTWHDDSDPKGFHIFDLQHRRLDFIQNPYKMFNKLYYDDVLEEDAIKSDIKNSVFNKYSNTYLKIIVKNKKNPYLFDVYIDNIYKINPIDLVIIEETSDVLAEELNDIDETDDTITILSKYIDNIKPKDIDQNRLKHLITELYNEAIDLDTI